MGYGYQLLLVHLDAIQIGTSCEVETFILEMYGLIFGPDLNIYVAYCTCRYEFPIDLLWGGK